MSFEDKVFSIVRKIPEGRVTTYKWIASKIGSRNSFRAVGNVLGKNEDLVNTPCFRVIRSDSQVGGYKEGQAKKVALLRKEGIKIVNNKILDLNSHFFEGL